MLQPGTISAAGRVLAGRYRIEGLLGEGSTGAVYEGTHMVLGSRVAIKLIHRDVADQQWWRARFYDEARLLAQVSSPWVAQVHDFGEDTETGALFLVMEFLGGTDLARLIGERGPLNTRRACAVGAQILHGLAAAHATGVLHRDLGLANVMVLSADTDQPFAKIIDFGLGTAPSPDSDDELVLGAPLVMAPERINREHEEDARCDIYSFGCVLYAMLTGQMPFAGPTTESVLRMHLTEEPKRPSTVAPHRGIPPELDALVMQCLAKTPGHRYPTADAVAEVLEHIERTLPDPPDLSEVKPDDDALRSDNPAAELTRNLARAYDSFRVYPRQNVAYRDSMNVAGRMLSELFLSSDVVTLSFDRYSVYCDGEQVACDIDRRSLSYALWNDGMRHLQLLKGMRPEELDRFFDCLYSGAARKARGAGPVAMLWDLDFDHIQYHLAEDIERVPLPSAAELSALRCLGGDADAVPRGARALTHTGAHALLCQPLTDDEIRQIVARTKREKGRDPTMLLVGGLLSTLRGCSNPTLVGELLGVLGDLARDMVEANELAEALKVLKPIASLRNKPGGRTVAKAVENALLRSAEPDTVRRLVDRIGADVNTVDPDLFVGYARCMGPAIVGPLVDCCPGIIDKKTEETVARCLVRLGMSDPRVLGRFADGAYGEVGHLLVSVLMRIGKPECGPILSRVLRTGDAEVRRQAIYAMDVIDHPRKATWLASRLEDPAMAVRMAVYDVLAGLPKAAGARPLTAMIGVSDLAQRPVAELEALFGALARCGDADTVVAIERLLGSGSSRLRRAVGKLTRDANWDPMDFAMLQCLELMDEPAATAAINRLVSG
ncbi:MAG: serine/threonine protein kinase [Myxococcota bacterium]|jgi:serine/threonine protein kinase